MEIIHNTELFSVTSWEGHAIPVTTNHVIIVLVDAIVKLVEFLYDSLYKKSHTLCVLVDLMKEFDTVYHEILLHKLLLYGNKFKAFYLIESYLHYRVQSVRLGTVFSDDRNINI